MTPVENIKPVGAPPGSIIYTGEQSNEKVAITLIEYNENEFIEETFEHFDHCFSRCKDEMTKWINVDGIHKTEVIEQIGKLFSIHPLTLEDIANPDQRPKFEDYDSYLYSTMKMIYFDGAIQSEQLSIILLPNLVISFQEVHGGDAFDLIRRRLRQGKGRIRKMGADYLYYALHDAVVDCYFNILEKIGDDIEELEDALTNEPSKKLLTELFHYKRQIIYLRKAVWPMRELVNNMERSDSELIKEGTKIYLRDVHDHAIRAIDTVETYRDLLAGMMDLYLSSLSNKMNEVMKVLTIMSSIFIPVTFIAGVYGMNFEYMPELKSPYGYWITWGVMITIIVSLLIYFRRKKWM